MPDAANEREGIVVPDTVLNISNELLQSFMEKIEPATLGNTDIWDPELFLRGIAFLMQ